jgi:hypothetical protein
MHFVDRDDSEKYVVFFTGDDTTPIEVYSLLDGAAKSVTYNPTNIGENLFSDPGLDDVTEWTASGVTQVSASIFQFDDGDYIEQSIPVVYPNYYRVAIELDTGAPAVIDTDGGAAESWFVEVGDSGVDDVADDTELGIFQAPAGVSTVTIRITYNGNTSQNELHAAFCYQCVEPGDYKKYATTDTPEESIKALTIADTTVVSNIEVTPEKSGFPDLGWEFPFALINITHGVAGQTYNVEINGVTYSYTTGDSTQYSTYRTTYIAEQLATAIDAGLGSDWQISYRGSAILVWNSAGDDFTFSVNDSWGDSAMVGIKEEARRLEDLPNTMPIPSSVGAGDYGAVATTVLLQREDDHEDGVSCTITVTDSLANEVSVDSGEYAGWGGSWLTLYRATAAKSLATKLQTALDSHGDMDGYVVQYIPGSASFRINSSIRTFTVTSSGTGPTRILNTLGYASDGTKSPQEDIVIYVGPRVTDALGTGYYLKWVDETKDGKGISGVWRETVKPFLDNHLNGLSCPHSLVRQANGTFNFAPINWVPRAVGDEDSSPDPSFVGYPITDIFFHKNRVGFLAANNVMLSRVDDYFNFYPNTALEVTDDDPMDITIPSMGLDALRWAIADKGDLLVYGATNQHLLTSGDQVFGAKTASMDSATNYPVSPHCRPVLAGANIYFVSPKGEWAALYEYFTQPQTLREDAADVTAHAPRYVPYDVKYLASSSTFNLLLTCTGLDNYVYGYRYEIYGDKKAQSAWFTWSFPFTVKAVEIFDNIVYIVGATGLEYVLYTMNLERVSDDGLEFLCHLDSRTEFDSTGTYSAVTGLTTFTLPFSLSEEDFDEGWVLVNLGTGKEVDGLTWVDETTLTVLGNYSAAKMLIGSTYTQTYTFSEFGLPASDQAKIFNPQGRLQLRTLIVAYQETVMFDCVVTPTGTVEGGREAITHEYTGVEIGLTTLGSVPMPSSKKRFLIMGNAIGTTISLVNSSHFPATWYEASWEGMYAVRSRSI